MTVFEDARSFAARGMAVCAAVLVLLLAAPVRAEVIETPADFAILTDAKTGQVLYSKNPDALMAPASMSKLMTLTMLFERIKSGQIGLDDTIRISEAAWRKGGAASGSSTMFAEVNSEVPVRDILRGIIVQSGNDACIAVAEAIGGTEQNFADMMTTRARELGLSRSTFANSTGWPDPSQRMTARELAMLARYIIQTFPDFLPLFAEQSFTWNGITQSNRNPLIYSFRGADGLKTGHTEDSGYGLVGTARQGERRVILVVNGLASDRARARETKRLMSIAFASYTEEKLFAAGDPVGSIDVFHGKAPEVPAVTDRDVSAFIHRSARRDIKIRLAYQSPLKAPIAKGAEIGTMTVEAPGLEPVRAPVYAGADVPELGIFGKALLALDHLIFSDKAAPKGAMGAGPNGG
ncbi:MAG: D-alanyl-D-alanine carboxypeptidase family protein [Alphaproteobacteria bacterium]